MLEMVCGDSPTIWASSTRLSPPGGAADGIENDSQVEVAHPGQVGSAPRRGLADLGQGFPYHLLLATYQLSLNRTLRPGQRVRPTRCCTGLSTAAAGLRWQAA